MPFKSKKQRKWMHANNPGTANKWEKYDNGGKFKGPSHDNGGIDINVEGGEFIVKKDSVNPRTEAILKYINKNGKLPTDEYDILPSINAKDRSKK